MNKILIAIDESDAAQRAVRYVGSLVRDAPHVAIRLVHLIPPPAVMEGGSTGDLEADLQETRARVQAEMKAAEPIFASAKAALRDAGVPEDAIEAECRADPEGVDVVRGCLDVARESGCGTIVLGRESLGRVAEVFHSHPSDALVKKSEGLAIWVVG